MRVLELYRQVCLIILLVGSIFGRLSTRSSLLKLIFYVVVWSLTPFVCFAKIMLSRLSMFSGNVSFSSACGWRPSPCEDDHWAKLRLVASIRCLGWAVGCVMLILSSIWEYRNELNHSGTKASFKVIMRLSDRAHVSDGMESLFLSCRRRVT